MAVRRINIDLKELEESRKELNENGIYWHINESNIFQWWAVIKGTSDTPYEFSYHFFRVMIPSNYPFEPPRFYYCTGDGKMRMNPNLYELPSNMTDPNSGGKTCLSLLNTWNGPSWTPVNSIKTILITIQAAVLVNDPLKNEPGKENSPSVEIKAYNDLVTYKSLELALYNQLVNPMEEFKVFLEDMNNSFLKDFDNIMKKIDSLIPELNGISLKAGIWSNTYGILNYVKLKEKLIQHRDSILSPVENTVQMNDASGGGVEKKPEITSVKKSPAKKTRRAPDVSAKSKEVGFIMDSIIDGESVPYVVKVRKDGVHYWAKYKG